MPSGAKKRKSTKKKKKKSGGNNNKNALFFSSATATEGLLETASPSFQGGGEEDLLHDGDKETDGGEASYSASQDHQFNDREGNGDKQLEISHSESSIHTNKSNAWKNVSNEANIVERQEGGTVQVESESMSHNINTEYVEPARSPHKGGLRRRSSSSSKPAMSENIVNVATNGSDIDVVALHSIGSSEKENEKRELRVMDEKTRASDVFVDTGLKKRGHKANISMSSKDDDKLDLSYDVPTVDGSIHGDDMNGSTHDHQPPVALAPRPAQTTSWKSCCGLFEVFTGSNK